MFDRWVIDASMGCRDGAFCFCPLEGDLEGDYSIVTGFNLLSDKAPASGKIVAVVHEDGQAAVEAFCEEHKDALARLSSRET